MEERHTLVQSRAVTRCSWNQWNNYMKYKYKNEEAPEYIIRELNNIHKCMQDYILKQKMASELIINTIFKNDKT